jgi:hypothetical protein
VAEGVTGGLVTLILFVYLLIVAVKTIGSGSLRPFSRSRQWFIWCLCVSVLGHCSAFFGVGYFGQIRMLLYLTLAITAAIYEKCRLPAQRAYGHKPVAHLREVSSVA